MRYLWLAIVFVLSQVCGAEQASVLVFIKTQYAGPAIPDQIDDHPLWVKWPQREAREVLWPVLSVTTGQHWRITESDLTISSVDGKWAYESHISFVNRGIAIRLQSNLDGREFTVLGNPQEGASRIALIAGISPKSSNVSVISGAQPLQDNNLYVTEVRSWDEVAAIRRRTNGRILVLEWPEETTKQLTHFWLMGEGWKSGVPKSNDFRTNGTLALTEIGRLLATPEEFKFSSINRGEVGRRWGGEAQENALGLVALAVLLAGVLAIATWNIAQERNPPWVRTGLDSLLLLPSCFALSGVAARYLGPELMWLSIPPLLIVLLLAANGIGRLLGREDGAVSQVAILSGINVCALAFGEPSWSPLSSVFVETDRPMSGLWVGCWLLSLIGLAGVSSEKPTKWTWAVRFILLGLFLAGLTGQFWWGAAGLVILSAPVWAVMVSERWLSNWIIAGAIFGCGAFSILRGAVVFAPLDRFVTYWDIEALNVWWYAFGLRDPAFWFVVGLCVLLRILGDRFYFRQLKRATQNSAQVKSTSFIIAAGLLLPASEPRLYDAVIAGFLLWLVVLHREALLLPESA